MVFEQTAIVLYLADKFPEAHLGPAIGDPARGRFLPHLPIIQACSSRHSRRSS
jgi:glutathione S-transferase